MTWSESRNPLIGDGSMNLLRMLETSCPSSLQIDLRVTNGRNALMTPSIGRMGTEDRSDL